MMSTVHFSQVIVVFVLLAGCSFARFWQLPTVEPTTQSPQYYETFQTVPPPEKTADKFMTNFLNFPVGNNRTKRSRRQIDLEDLVIVMDGSGSIPSCEFDKGKKALKTMMTMMDTAATDTKYAVVTFSTSARVEFGFVRNPPAGDNLLRIAYPNGMTNTQAGLAEAKNLFQNSSAGARTFSRKVVLLVTDGQSNVMSHLTLPNAKELKVGVDLYVVAVGSYIDGIDEMVKVASSPPENRVFRVNSLSGFYGIIKLILEKVNPVEYRVVDGQYEPPC